MSKKVYIVGDDVYVSSTTWRTLRALATLSVAFENAYYDLTSGKGNKHRYNKVAKRFKRSYTSFLANRPTVIRTSERSIVPKGYRKRNIETYATLGMDIEDAGILSGHKKWWNWGQ